MRGQLVRPARPPAPSRVRMRKRPPASPTRPSATRRHARRAPCRSSSGTASASRQLTTTRLCASPKRSARTGSSSSSSTSRPSGSSASAEAALRQRHRQAALGAVVRGARPAPRGSPPEAPSAAPSRPPGPARARRPPPCRGSPSGTRSRPARRCCAPSRTIASPASRKAAARDVVQVLHHAHHPDGGRGVDGAARVLVVERDVAARHRRLQHACRPRRSPAPPRRAGGTPRASAGCRS